MNETRDPYTTPHAPKSKSGPVLRYVIVAGLLAVGAAAFFSMSDGPGLTESAEQTEQSQLMADAGDAAPAPLADSASDTTAPPASNTPSPAPAPSSAPAPTEEVPPPSTVTVPPAE